MELFGLDRAELSIVCQQLGQPAFRGAQIARWLYDKGVRDFASMTNLPSGLREEIARSHSIFRCEVSAKARSADNATKYLLKLADAQTIESVLLPYPDRTSVCVSTQIGCPAGCVFCATAMCGFVRNLSAGEIADQVLTLQQDGGQRISHVVMMGMGEPLLNFDNVIKALHLLNDEIGIGMRRMTISSVGISPAIDKLRDLDLQITLAISLHAPEDNLRQKLVPVSRKYPLDELMRSCTDYTNHTRRRITFEYLLLAGVNDSVEQALALAELLRGSLCNVNLIPYNEVQGLDYKRPTRDAISAFRNVLQESGIEVTQRMERGHSISAACGQLRRRHISD
jgi:23S rRNA (adenine2503-C2)-methyltransferase